MAAAEAEAAMAMAIAIAIAMDMEMEMAMVVAGSKEAAASAAVAVENANSNVLAMAGMMAAVVETTGRAVGMVTAEEEEVVMTDVWSALGPRCGCHRCLMWHCRSLRTSHNHHRAKSASGSPQSSCLTTSSPRVPADPGHSWLPQVRLKADGATRRPCHMR